MDAKLTLKLDKQVIDRAKKYASSHKISLSRMIESYLKAIVDKEAPETDEEIEISPFVKSMATGVRLPKDLDHKKMYGEHLAEKYQ